MGLFGLQRTGFAAAFLDVLCAVAAVLLGDRVVREKENTIAETTKEQALPFWFLLLAAAAGFVALAEELLWTRALLPYANSSTYAFAAILGLYLLGIAGGSFVLSRREQRGAEAGLLFRVQLALAVSVAATPLLFSLGEKLFPLYVGVRRATTFSAWLSTVFGVFFKAAFGLLLPTMLLGATTVLALRFGIERGFNAARTAGAYGSANTVGAIVGSIFAGFVLLPALGAHRSILLCALLHLLLALVWNAFQTEEKSSRVTTGIVLLAVALLAWGTPAVPFTGRLTAGARLLLLDEGPQDTTAVAEYAVPRGHYRVILSNGVSYAGDRPKSQRYMGLLGHLPALLSTDPSRALVICVGTGTTASAVARHSAVRSLTLVDISPVVHRTLPHFAHVNRSVWRDPRVQIVEADGRQFLSRNTGSFGVIALEPPPPRVAGSASLYNRELYERARAALRSGGVLAQWLPLHGMTAAETWMLTRTFLQVFPDGALFVLTDEEAALVGGPSFRPSLQRMRERLSEESVAQSLRLIGFRGTTPEALLQELLLASPVHGSALRALAGQGPLLTDDAPLIEQFAVGLARGEGTENNADSGRSELFAVLARTPPRVLPVDGALPEGIEEALRLAWSRNRAQWPGELAER